MTKEASPVRGYLNKAGDFVLEYLVLIAIILLVVVTAIIEPRFLTLENFTNIMRQFGPLSFTA